MIVEASVPGFVRTILIIVGVLVLLRFLGQLLQAKRNMENERAQLSRENNLRKERDQKMRDFGKTRIVKNGNVKGNVQDVDFEEVE